MSNTHQMIDNLKQAVLNKQTIKIGGATFYHKGLEDFLGHYRSMQDALVAARLLCENLEKGGDGLTATLVDNFRIQDEKV